MVGLVVVSHSRALARAAVALAEEMVRGQDVPIAIAAGLDETTLGTDAVQIVEALHAVDRGDGVVVLMDLGSAVLAAELALDLLEDDEARQRVLLCPAPLVEGLVVATVAAAAGSSAQEVAAEARRALAGKESQLGPPAEPPAAAPPELASEANGRFTVRNPHGLHARPAALLVQRLRDLDGRVQLRNATTGSDWVSATSLSRVATLGAVLGHEVEVRADGPRADEAVQTVLALAADSFGESAASGKLGTPPVPIARIPASEPTGVAPGIGIGPALRVTSDVVDVPAERTEDPARDWRRLVDAIARSRADIVRARDRVAIEVGDEEAAILDAHVLLLDDAELLNDVETRVRSGQAAASAWSGAIIDVADRLAALPDPYLQARAADVRFVGGHVLRQLLGGRPRTASRAGVIVADDLSPVRGSPAGSNRRGGGGARLRQPDVAQRHSGSQSRHSHDCQGGRGDPRDSGRHAARRRRQLGRGGRRADTGCAEGISGPGDRRRGTGPASARLGRGAGRDPGWRLRAHRRQCRLGRRGQGRRGQRRGSGRTGAHGIPVPRAQSTPVGRRAGGLYRDLAQAMGGRRIVVRTLDVGGDKSLRYLPQPIEANPFLGVRGIRFALRYPQLLADQLLAIVRVAHDFPVSVLFPMVSALDELTAARRLLDEAVTAASRGTPAGFEIGIMVEVPAAALNASVFVPHVDFFSIGTNDLTQYAMASERGNSALAALADPLDPAVLRLIDLVGRAAGDRLPIAVCGELAADERATGLLVGLGVRELSVVPTAVPAIKQAVRDLTSAEAGALAAAALTKGSAADVRALLRAGQLGRVSERTGPNQDRALAFACWNSASVMTPRSRRSASRASSSAAPPLLEPATLWM